LLEKYKNVRTVIQNYSNGNWNQKNK
jgi:hypothetical protein